MVTIERRGGVSARRHSTAAIAILLLTALLAAVLVGCTAVPTPTPTPKESSMNATEAHDELDHVLLGAQRAIGGSWQSLDGGAEICRTASSEKGAVFPFMRLGPGVPPDQQAAIFATVAEQWKTAGFAPTMLDDSTIAGVAVSELRYPATGNGVDGVYLSLRLSINASDAEGQSRCIPGDADKINEQRQPQG
jgi:hypothetical protein